jgi:hypothetical protein
MRRVHYHAVTCGLLVARDQAVMMKELVVPEAFVHADGLAGVGGRYRVARRAHRYQGIIGDPALLDPLVTIRQPRSERRELFAGKAIHRPFVSRPMKPRISDLRAPAF